MSTLLRSQQSVSCPRQHPGRWLLRFVCWSLLLGLPGISLADELRSSLTEELRRIYFTGAPETLDDLRLMDAHQRELVRELSPVTVAVRIGPTQGSGVIIHEDGYVLTAAHVAGQPGLNVQVYLPDATKVPGQTLGMNKNMDAGLIKIDPQVRDGQPVKWPFAKMGNASELNPGAWCIAFGHPGGFQPDRKQPVARFGRVLSRSKTTIETECKLVGGDSGGPLFDMEGNVIGIHSRIGNKLTKNLHVPVDAYRDSWDRLVRGDSWGSLSNVIGRPVIGVIGQEDTEEARIAQVLPASPAERAGIQVGDLVTKFARKEVKTFNRLQQLVSERNPGDEVEIEILRGAKTFKFHVVLGALSGNN